MSISVLEQALELMIMENKTFVQERGFPVLLMNTVRQYRLPNGKICDIISYTKAENKFICKIFELKKEELGLASLLQVIEYGTVIAKYAKALFEDVSVELFLVGKDVSYDLFHLIA